MDEVEMGGKDYQGDLKTKVGRSLGAEARTQEQAARQQEQDQGEEGSQDDWKTKAWRSLAGDLMRGSYLQGAAAEFLTQKKALLPDPGPSSYKLSLGGSRMIGECGQDVWRSLAKFFRGGRRAPLPKQAQNLRRVQDHRGQGSAGHR